MTAKHPENSHRTDSPCAGKHNTCPAENSPCPGKLGNAEKNSGQPAASRHVPSEVRERVLERPGYQCEYRSPNGRRCSSRTGLQVEHVRPYAVYKAHDEQHLRAFCPPHNLHAAKEYFGREFVEEKIASAGTRKGKISQSDKGGATKRSGARPQASQDSSSSPACSSSGVREGFR